VEKDATLNKLSGNVDAGFFVVMPQFTKRLSEKCLTIQTATETRATSCAFDLAGLLGLLPGQPNEAFGEFEMVALDDLVHNGDTYCARISRHCLVLLISEHVQEIWQVEDCTHISTNIGLFTISKRDRRSIAHFDGSTRTSTVDVIAHQTLTDIKHAAMGEYLCETANGVEWRNMTPRIYAAEVTTPAVPRAVRYMRHHDIEEWHLVSAYAVDLGIAMGRVIDSVSVPESFVEALATDWTLPGHSPQSDPERLAQSVQLVNMLIRKIFEESSIGEQARVVEWYILSLSSLGVVTRLVSTCFSASYHAHRLFRARGKELDPLTFINRAFDRFHETSHLYRQGSSSTFLQNRLQTLLESHGENVGLVVMQGSIAVLAQFNAQLVLARTIEAPEQWFRIVFADDGDMFLGAA
jgi:hypothetical protein